MAALFVDAVPFEQVPGRVDHIAPVLAGVVFRVAHEAFDVDLHVLGGPRQQHVDHLEPVPDHEGHPVFVGKKGPAAVDADEKTDLPGTGAEKARFSGVPGGGGDVDPAAFEMVLFHHDVRVRMDRERFPEVVHGAHVLDVGRQPALVVGLDVLDFQAVPLVQVQGLVVSDHHGKRIVDGHHQVLEFGGGEIDGRVLRDDVQLLHEGVDDADCGSGPSSSVDGRLLDVSIPKAGIPRLVRV